MGRRKKPTAELMLYGTYRTDRHGSNGDVGFKTDLIEGSVNIPEYFDDVVGNQFRQFAERQISLNQIDSRGMQTIVHAFQILQEANQLYGEMREINAKKAKAALTDQENTKALDEEYSRKNKLWRDNVKAYTSIAIELGIGPVQRAEMISHIANAASAVQKSAAMRFADGDVK